MSRVMGARVMAAVTVLIMVGSVLGCATAGRDAGSSTNAESPIAAPTTAVASPSDEGSASSDAAATQESLTQEAVNTSTPQPLAEQTSVPDETAFFNGEVILPDECAWLENDEGRVNLVDGFASMEDGIIRMSVTVKQTAVVTLDGKAYRAVIFACWGGGNLVYDHMGFYDDASAPPAIQTGIQIAAGPYQSNAIFAVEGTLKPIDNGFHLEWVGEFLPTDEACSACATGAAEADFVWNGSFFDVRNKTTWQRQD
ncbi:hypothetical protein [Actinomyces qiguomingii]|uniref:hypothetical protein n=1 Tax=Actinomyces qiguomingii TaxID=2057800 RepID=UPI000FFEC1DC|nr:hypothetical protein [Actinomyces qiguomingii]